MDYFNGFFAQAATCAEDFDLAPVIPPLVSRVRSGFALFGLGDQQARERSHCGAQAIGPVGF